MLLIHKSVEIALNNKRIDKSRKKITIRELFNSVVEALREKKIPCTVVLLKDKVAILAKFNFNKAYTDAVHDAVIDIDGVRYLDNVTLQGDMYNSNEIDSVKISGDTTKFTRKDDEEYGDGGEIGSGDSVTVSMMGDNKQGIAQGAERNGKISVKVAFNDVVSGREKTMTMGFPASKVTKNYDTGGEIHHSMRAMESMLKDSGFNHYKGTPKNKLKHNRGDKTAIISKGSVTITSNTPNTKDQIFTTMKEMVDYLNKNEIYAKGGSVNKDYLNSISTEKKSKILKNIAKHYGISVKEMEEELIDEDAEKLFEYIANDDSLRMSVYKDFKVKGYAKGGDTDGGFLGEKQKNRYLAFVGEKESRGYPLYVRIKGYPATTSSYHKTKELAQKKADTLNAKNQYATGGVVDGYDIDNILHHYYTAGLWATSDGENESLDENYTVDDISDDTREQLKKAIKLFIEENKDILKKHNISEENIGHDLFLTSQGHGAGFWDRGYGDDGEVLSESSKKYFSSNNPYSGDNEKVYFYANDKFAKGGDVVVYGTTGDIKKMYLDYVNNFLTVKKFAEHYNISVDKANRIIEKGKYYSEIKHTYADFGNDHDAFTNYVMDRLDNVEERQQIRKDWNKQAKTGEKDWNTYLLKRVNKKTDWIKGIKEGQKIDAPYGMGVVKHKLDDGIVILYDKKKEGDIADEVKHDFDEFSHLYAKGGGVMYAVENGVNGEWMDWFKTEELAYDYIAEQHSENESLKGHLLVRKTSKKDSYAKGGKVKRPKKATFFNESKKKDASRIAKPYGYRIKGKDNMRKPSLKEVKQGFAVIKGKKFDIYYETRPEKSDVQPYQGAMLKDGGIVRDKNKNSWDDKIKFLTKYNATPMTKGDLMEMAYGKNYSGVDSALPKSLWNEVDNTFYYVYDYNDNVLGGLVDLRIKLKNSKVPVTVTIAKEVGGKRIIIRDDKLPKVLKGASFSEALDYIYKNDKVTAFSIRPKN